MEILEKRILGKTGFNVSVLGFGGIIVDQTEQRSANNYVSEAIDWGINYFDVAPGYGQAQYILGPALEPYRNKVYLACKTDRRDSAGSLEQLHESLKALKTDYFDVYQFHGLDSLDEIKTVFSPGGAMETMIKAKEQGFIRNIGFTCHTEEAAFEILRYYDDFSTVLFPINWAYWLEKGIGNKLTQTAKEKNMGIIAIKALADRKWLENEEKPYPKCWYKPIFDNDELAGLALRFTLSKDIGIAIPPGDIELFRKCYNIIANFNDFELSEHELSVLKAMAAKNKNILF